MENELHNNDVLSLKEIGLINVAILICNNVETLDLFREFRFQSKKDYGKLKDWSYFIDVVAKQALQLDLPEVLVKEVMPLIKPVGAQVLKWRNFMENFFYDKKDLFNYMYVICWTFQGIVDYRATAQNIVKQKSLDIITRYELSCLFCLEDEIQAIWEKLTDQEKVLYNDREITNIQHTGVLSFWKYAINGDLTASYDCLCFATMQKCTVYQYAFENAASTGNLVATQYFFPKLTYEERGESLVKTADNLAQKICFGINAEMNSVPNEIYSDILCYLIENMTKEEQNVLFEKYPLQVLLCYINWPRQKLFPRLMQRMWSFIDENEYHCLIRILAKNVNVSAYNYSKLFQVFYLESSISFKMSILDKQCENGTFLSDLFDTNDVENIKLVLRDVKACKKKLFISDSGFQICLQLVLENKLDLLQVFMQECLLSKEIRSKAEASFKLFLTRVYTKKQIKSKRYKFAKFFLMLSQADVTERTNQKFEAKCPKSKKFRKM